MSWLLASLVAGSLIYCILVIVAARRYLSVRPLPLRDTLPISVLKPLAGLDDGLESNLRTFFEQDYSPSKCCSPYDKSPMPRRR